MGREVKRVALDFEWPMDKRWEGFCNPHRVPQCEACEGDGGSPWSRRFSKEWYGNSPFDHAAYGVERVKVDHPAIQAFARRNVERHPDYHGTGEAAVAAEARRLWGHWSGQWSHHLTQTDVDALVAANRLHDFKDKKPTADEVNAWSMAGGMGHDAINQWVCVRARCKRERVPQRCAYCKGSGEDQRPKAQTIKKAHDAWKSYEPPAGDGWQMWETVSEGSPISPVFATPEELARWLSTSTVWRSNQTSYETWLRMISVGWAPSLVASVAGVQTGVEFAGREPAPSTGGET